MSPPAIVIVAWNRPASLARLLAAVAQADIPAETPLAICLDGGAHEDVQRLAEAFSWTFGPKRVIQQPKRLGLNPHILTCGDLTKEYGSIILLEDDLLVSPFFYPYARQALDFYKDHPKIGGISLYRYKIAESNSFYPFEPLGGENEMHFLQLGVSWGQAWTAGQWKAFREWLAAGHSTSDGIARFMENWMPDDWKKHFTRFLMATGRYMACPAVSYTTNFADRGTNFSEDSHLYQVPLALAPPAGDFILPDDTVLRYDACFEQEPAAVKAMIPGLKDIDFAVDLYGTKSLADIDRPYLLSTRPCSEPLRAWGLRMRPVLANVVHDIEGSAISLGKTTAFPDMDARQRLAHYTAMHEFFYPLPKLRSRMLSKLLKGMRII